MIRLDGIPRPEDAPEPGACVRTEPIEDGVVRLVLDPPHRKIAVLDAPLLADLDTALSDLEANPPRGLVLAGRRPDQFAAGADVHAIRAIVDPQVLRRLVVEIHGLFQRLAALPCRKVAAVGGPVPGGAYELALTCDFIVACDDARTRIGLPETMLGIIPAWGGSHRLPSRVGVPTALQAILTGRLYAPKQALKLGMVDRLTKPEYLQRVAADVAAKRQNPRRRKRGWKSYLIDRNPLAGMLIARGARRQVMAKTRGNYPAPLRAIDLVTDAVGKLPGEMAEREAAVAADLATGSVAKNLIQVFLASEEAKKSGRPVSREQPLPKIERAAVIGGGVMGGAIAGLMADRGVSTRLVDLSREVLDKAVVEHRQEVTKRGRKRRTPRHETDAAIDRLEVGVSMSGLSRAQFVIEAVAEKLDVKRKVLGAVAERVSEDAVLATNTSSLSVDTLAAELPQPERVVGMHFFNPARKMPLVEVVRGRKTDEHVVRRTAALALALGKTPVVVRDVPGFLVNRVLGPYLDEAVRLFEEGADWEAVDESLLDFGMPMGPFALLDEVGFDIAVHAAESLHAGYGVRMTPSETLQKWVAEGRLGKKTGRGFYVHQGGKRTADPALKSLSRPATPPPKDEILDRLVLSMVNEAVRCLEERVVDGPVALDLAMVFGTGFAPFRGGVLRYADHRGLADVVARLEYFAQSPTISARAGGSKKFTPAESLQRHAKAGTRFHDAGPAPA